MSAPSVLDVLFDALGDLRAEMRPFRPAYAAFKALLGGYFRGSAFTRPDAGPVAFGPFGTIDLPYRRMGAIDSVDLFGIDELLIFAFYRANRKLYRRTLDVGANLGLHSIVMARAGFEVTAFEPDPVHFDLLTANLSRNGISSVKPERAAVSDADGQLEFVRVVGNTTGSHLAGAKADPYGPLERFPVPVLAFAPLAAGADFAKVDAEGHEVTILKSVPTKTWERFDVMVEIGTPENAAALFDHFRLIGIGLYAQKIGWERATKVEHLPTSHREGSVFVTARGRMPWGDA